MRAAILVIATVLAFLASSPSQAERPQNPPIGVTTCVEHGGSVEQPEGSAIRACCMYSDITGIKGCYICDNQWNNCTWEPSFRSQVNGQIQGGGNLSVSPDDGGGKKPRLPLVKVPGVVAPQ